MVRPLELLAPAKNIECGIAAISHGADAVYIGAEHFGARAAAGNSTEDIKRLCEYAHTYLAKVYVTVNTIIFDNELHATQDLISSLYEAGADAILVQDMGILKMQLPPIELHASTQTDNRTAEKVSWLKANGFSRIVLARELSIREISEIHKAEPGVELEAFVHGALCVSFSGTCYASQYCFKRSANRGECAQFCRMGFDLVDSLGQKIEQGRHLLSLKDMCRYDMIEDLAAAGVTSFKIEGRLKDVTYVKNVTAAYSQKLDEVISRHPDLYRRASLGRCRYTFTPNLNKTFNRGFTDYFLNGRTRDIASFDTPKAIGEAVGHVKEIRNNTITVAGSSRFANGDGLCFINQEHKLEGFRVNKVVNNKITPLKMPSSIKPGTILYRNNDHEFEKLLQKETSTRKISIDMDLEETDNGIALTLSLGSLAKVSVEEETNKQKAQKPQQENITRQLTKLGNTPFECNKINFHPSGFDLFIPSSTLSDIRRKAVAKLTESLQSMRTKHKEEARQGMKRGNNEYPQSRSYMYNISNKLARQFYEEHGKQGLKDAFELREPDEPLLMQCRHCIRFSLGHCTNHGGTPPKWKEPLFLKSADGRRFRLQFDCKNCQMNVYADK